MQNWKKGGVVLGLATLLVGGTTLPLIAHGQEQPIAVVAGKAGQADKPAKHSQPRPDTFSTRLAQNLGMTEQQLHDLVALTREQDAAALLAPVLEQSTDAIVAELQAGKTAVQVAQDQGMDRDTLQAALVAALNAQAKSQSPKKTPSADEQAHRAQAIQNRVAKLLDENFLAKGSGNLH